MEQNINLDLKEYFIISSQNVDIRKENKVEIRNIEKYAEMIANEIFRKHKHILTEEKSKK